MTGFRRLLAVFFGLFLSSSLFGQNSSERTPSDLSGDWVLTTVVFGENIGERLQLKVEKDQLSGTLLRDEAVSLKEAVHGQELKFSFKESGGDQSEYKGRISSEALIGEYTTIDSHGEKTTGAWFAQRIPVRPAGGLHRLDFVPQVFQRAFSSKVEPVLHIWPGDTVHTTSVDAGGADEKASRGCLVVIR